MEKHMFKSWDEKLEARYNPEIRYGLFGLGGGGAGSSGGQANDGGTSSGQSGSSSGGGSDHGGEIGDNRGGGEPSSPSNSNKASDYPGENKDPLGDIFGDLAAAEVKAAEIIAQGARDAAREIRAGMEAAAKATIEAAKLAADAVLKMAKIADDRVREFWNIARADLKPIIDQGRYAADEYAAMLGIPNADGEIVPWDGSDLEDTPGYQWDRDQALLALQNSAQGTKLSGENTINTIALGQQIAGKAFTSRLEQLGFIMSGGWDAARDQANAATQTGSTYQKIYTTAGSDIADVESNKGTDLANIYTQGGIALGNVYSNAANQRAGLITGLATTGANLRIAQMNADAQRAANKSNNSGSIFGTIFGLGKLALGLG